MEIFILSFLGMLAALFLFQHTKNVVFLAAAVICAMIFAIKLMAFVFIFFIAVILLAVGYYIVSRMRGNRQVVQRDNPNRPQGFNRRIRF